MPLKVAHLSPRHGGVANAARQIHEGLLDIGVESRLFMSPPPADDPGRHVYPMPPVNRIGELADRLSRRLEGRTGFTGMTHVTTLFQSFPHFDVIHFHGMDGHWFNLHALPKLDRHHALVWTMHDKHLGTGACGYPEFWGGCERWKIGCGRCPKAESEGWWVDSTHAVYQRKKALVSSTRLALVALNRWMFDFVAAAPVTHAQPLTLIPSGVDTGIFAPMSQVACRRKWGLPAHGRLLLTVASKLNEPRKGLQYLEPLLHHLKRAHHDEIGLVLAGAKLSSDVLARLQSIVPVYGLGQIDGAPGLAQVYGACDVLLVTSMIDNSPNVILESMACGTPVAAFRVGGIPDMVEPGLTGVLSEPGDIATLAAQIGALCQTSERLLDMRSHCRARAVRDYARTVQASRYRELYDSLCEARHAAGRT